jgi:drug/metabolite transporter (DMT)-like permease
MAKATTTAGLFWCMVFLVLDAAQAVWFGALLQRHDAFLLGFLVFGISAVGCMIHTWFTAPSQYSIAFGYPGALLGLNLTAAGAWLTWFGAVQLIEPAVAFMIFSGLIPVTTIIAGWLGFSEGQRSRNRTEALGNGLIVLGMILLAVFTLTGLSGFVRGGPAVALFGLALAVVSGVLISLMLLFSQRLDRHGVGPVAQFGLRFPVYIVAAFLGWSLGLDDKGAVGALDLTLAVLAGLVLLAFPIYAVQKAVSQASSLTIAAVAATAPVLVFALQAVEGRVDVSPATSAGLAVAFAGAMLAALGAGRALRRERRITAG